MHHSQLARFARGIGVTGAALIGVLLATCALRAAVASADSFSWSAPIALHLERGAVVNGVACPSRHQCTAVDSNGQEVTFNPSSSRAATPTTIASRESLDGVACPSASQCTAVQGNGREVTLNPTSPGAPTPVTIVSGQFLGAVACPSTSQCTTVTSQEDGQGGVVGTEVTFNPTSHGTLIPTTIDSGEYAFLDWLACPSVSECTAMDSGGLGATFNPRSPGTPTIFNSIDSALVLAGLACPSARQCTAIDDQGNALTFNPASRRTANSTKIDRGGGLTGVACPSASQCTAIDGSGEVTFNPTSPTTGIRTKIQGTDSLEAIACASVAGCVAVDGAGHGFVGTRIRTNVIAGQVSVRGKRANVSIRCQGSRRGTCVVTLTLTETKTSSHAIVVLGTAMLTLTGGQARTVQLALNQTGRHLLALHHKLKVKLTITQSGEKPSSRTITFNG